MYKYALLAERRKRRNTPEKHRVLKNRQINSLLTLNHVFPLLRWELPGLRATALARQASPPRAHQSSQLTFCSTFLFVCSDPVGFPHDHVSSMQPPVLGLGFRSSTGFELLSFLSPACHSAPYLFISKGHFFKPLCDTATCD